MIVHDFHAICSIAVFPLEANSVLVVDADTVLALPIAPERFKPVPRQSRQVIQACSIIQYLQLSPSRRFKRLKATDPIVV